MADLCEIHAAELIAVVINLREKGIVIRTLIDDLYPASPRQGAHRPVHANPVATRIPKRHQIK